MSRIHEALKRAEQEKAAGQNDQQSEALADQKGAVLAEVASPNMMASVFASQVGTETLPEVLRFDELWAKCAHPQWKPNPDLLVFANANASNSAAEQFRTLRSRLNTLRENQPLQTVLVSSSIPGEGKSFVSANLADAMIRQQGCRVLLIDADLRAPGLCPLLGAPAGPGLVEYLQGESTEYDVIQRGYEEGFCFIPAGNGARNPAELLSSARMRQFLERAKPVFDWIIIDSPPVLPVADASVLAGMCDGVLFVVRANSTPSETAQKACREFRNTTIVGVVLNAADDALEYGGYYAYRGEGVKNPAK